MEFPNEDLDVFIVAALLHVGSLSVNEHSHSKSKNNSLSFVVFEKMVALILNVSSSDASPELFGPRPRLPQTAALVLEIPATS